MNDAITAAIEVRGLVKRFGRTIAVDGVDLSVMKRSVYGLSAPTAPGRRPSSVYSATLLRPDAGSAKVLGFDVLRESDAVRGRVGLTGQFASVDEDLTGRENLIMLDRLYGFRRLQAKSRADELLEAFGIADAAKRPVKTYSGGMRRRVDGTTVLLTTQYLEEADQLSDRIAVIDHGRIVAEGTSSELKSRVGTGSGHVRVRERSRVVPALARLNTEGIDLVQFSMGQPNLDEVFLALTGHDTRKTNDAKEES